MGGSGRIQADTSSSDPWWWVPNLVAILAGLALVGLGVYDHDNAALIDVGLATVAGAVGHAAGKQAPPP